MMVITINRDLHLPHLSENAFIDECDWNTAFTLITACGKKVTARPLDLSWLIQFGKYNTHYLKANFRGINVLMHRLITEAVTGISIDHINGNGLDNRRSNLRFASQMQNLWNTKPRNGTSRFKGVSIDPRGNWRAQIMCNYRKFTIGRFCTEIDAARAYDSAAIKLHGAYARLNFPVEVAQ